MNERILAGLAAGATVVTGSRRLARILRHEYDELQRARGAAAWETPSIAPWTGWIGSLWEDFQFTAQDPPTRLGAWQEWALWNSIIRRSPQSAELLQSASTASAAQKAWALAVAWRIKLDRVECEGNDDSRIFAQWAREFASVCESRGWIDGASAPDRLREAMPAIARRARVLLAGFDELTPQQTEFIEACRECGGELEQAPPHEPLETAKAVRAAFPDKSEEIAAAARWARGLLEADPRASIGVIVPDLAARRAAVERTFRATLEPGSQLPGAADTSALVNISAGKPLTGYPLVHAAVDILRLSPESNRWEQVSALALSRYIAGAESERSARGRLDARLRESGRTQLTAPEVLDAARDAAPAFELAFRNWWSIRKAEPSGQPSAAWAAAFASRLEAIGWPGEAVLSSEEYQTLEAWKDVLSTLAGAGVTAGEMSASEALSLVARIAADTEFQPESPDAPVQILGALEATGLQFDHLWVAGLDDESWPRPPSPDPFLPIRLQREAGAPRCSPERELAFARLATRRLVAGSPDVVLSYAVSAGDRELSPSPLILHVPKEQPPAPEVTTCARAIRASGVLEEFTDEQGPPLGEEAWQRGGAKVFQYQAACPFHAFAELRLGAADLENPAPGLDARQRGTLLHAALEKFWNEVRTHAGLCARTDIGEVVKRSVAAAVERIEEDRGAPLPKRFAAIERRRLEGILSEWLELEKRRQPFEVVDPEGERVAEVGGIRFKVRIDRIDRVAGDRDVIIDYKTAARSVSSWDSDRPEEPQLPLYSVVYREKPLAGVLFGQLKTGELKFKGFVDDGVVVKGADSIDLAARVAEWRIVMERLAAEFRAGRAEADPKDRGKSCRYCSLAALCRIAECDGRLTLEAE